MADNWEETTAWFNSDEVQKGVLEAARQITQEAGMIVSFEGFFRQGFGDRPNLINIDPFVIAQTPLEINLNSTGILQGTIFEFARSAIIRGQINSRVIDFIKQYRSGPDGMYNPNPIHYEGTANADGVYRGRWRFSSERATMCKEGTFEIIPMPTN